MEEIIAIVTTSDNRDKVAGNVPIIFAEDQSELEYVAMLISRITVSMVHDLGNGVRLLVKH